MHWLLMIAIFFNAMAQDPLPQQGKGIWKSICKTTADCSGYLICKKKKCVPPNKPSANKCAKFSYIHRQKNNQVISQCPPACGYQEDIILGPQCINDARGCEASKQCVEKGECGYKRGRCVLTKKGCASSALCRDKGLCNFDGKQCLPSVEGCSNSTLCKTQGWCLYKTGPTDHEVSHGRCEKDANGCMQSKMCTDEGKCGFKDGTCVATVMGCANSKACTKFGRCRYKKFVGCVH